MPQSSIDKILDKVIKGRTGRNAPFQAPITMSKAHWQFKKGNERRYLPKPPPPTLTAVRSEGQTVRMQGRTIRRKKQSWVRTSEWEVKTESETESQNWMEDTNMDWYPRTEDTPRESHESGKQHRHEAAMDQAKMEYATDKSWNGTPSEPTDQEIMDNQQQEENQWYQEWDGETGEEWPEEWPPEEEQQQQGPDPNESWEKDDQGTDQREWENNEPQQEGENCEEPNEWQEDEQPIPAPSLAPSRPGKGAKRPLFIPLNKGTSEGESAMGKGKMGHPTPLTHPSTKQNPLMRGKGGHPPICHPIFDPQHPVNRQRGWTPIPAPPTQWQQMHQQSTGWIPPVPQPIDMERQRMQQAYMHGLTMRGQRMGQMMNPAGRCYPMEPPMMQQFGGPNRYPATPQMHQMYRGDAQAMMNMEEDTGYNASNESDTSTQMSPKSGNRRNRKKEKTRKRHVMLTIRGKKVKASYREP